MSNHTAVTPDGGELGRAQAMQALAAGVETDRRMGPVLLKPSGARTSHVVVLGEEEDVTDAVSYGARARRLRPVVLDALQSLRLEHQHVILEGAGGAAEINLLDRDLVNLPLAAAAGLPAVLVVDIERGGAFASAYGTWALLPEELRSCLRGFVINNFRGDVSLLADGLQDLESRTGVPVLGVLPHLDGRVMLGQEDSLGLDEHAFGGRPGPRSRRPVRVAVVRLPHLANPADLDPLILEPSVELRGATVPADLADADLIILPGSRATVADLEWLRDQGLDEELHRRAADEQGPVILGICAGFQMLGQLIDDQVESGRGRTPALALLPVTTTFAAPKVVCGVTGTAVGATPGARVRGYEIRWGRPEPAAGARHWLDLDTVDLLERTIHPEDAERRRPAAPLRPEGCVRADGRVLGTSVHGILDEDSLRRSLIDDVATRRGRDFRPAPVGYAEALDSHMELLADWVEAHLELPRLIELAGTATPVHQEPGW